VDLIDINLHEEIIDIIKIYMMIFIEIKFLKNFNNNNIIK